MESKIDKILLVINPVAGDTDKGPIVEMVREYISESANLIIFKTTGNEDEAKIMRKAKDFNPDRILVAGGDGTVKTVARVGHELDTPIGILPLGSANGLATDLEIPDDSEKALAIALGGSTIIIDALKINDSLGLHISDFGINAELIKRYAKSNVRGRFGYFLNSLPTLWASDSPYEFRISTDEGERTVSAVMVAFSNCQKFGTGALVNPIGKINDGKFEVLIFKRLDVAEIVKTLRGQIDIDADFLEIISTTKAKVTTSKPTSFQIDGEPFGEIKEVLVSVIPNFIEIAISSAKAEKTKGSLQDSM